MPSGPSPGSDRLNMTSSVPASSRSPGKPLPKVTGNRTGRWRPFTSHETPSCMPRWGTPSAWSSCALVPRGSASMRSERATSEPSVLNRRHTPAVDRAIWRKRPGCQAMQLVRTRICPGVKRCGRTQPPGSRVVPTTPWRKSPAEARVSRSLSSAEPRYSSSAMRCSPTS